MKTFIFTFIFWLTFASVPTLTRAAVYDESIVPATDTMLTGNSQVLKNINLHDYTNITDNLNPNPSIKNSGAFFFRNIVTVIIRFIEKLAIPIAIVFLTIAAMLLIINRNDEEQFKNRVLQVIWMAVGFGVIMLSFTLVDKVFFGMQGEIIHKDSSVDFALLGRQEIDGLVKYAVSFAIAIGVLFLVIGSIQLIIAGENDDAAGKAKKNILYSILGITLIFLMYTIVNIFFGFDKQGKLKGLDLLNLDIELIKWSNILLGFIVFFGVIALIWAGVQMITHFGDEERVNKAKDIIKYVVVGIVLAFSAWTIVQFFLLPGT